MRKAPITGLEGKYEIWEDGTVYSFRVWRPLSPGFARGYPYVSLQGKNCYIHRLVAEHFIPNPRNLEEVDHVNGNRGDHRIDNLQWVSHSENMERAYERRKMSGAKHHSAKLTDWHVVNIRTLKYACGMTIQQITDAYKRAGLPVGSIPEILIGKIWRHV